ncbi:hypothetical protein [Methylorubrum aminovorans]|nr:hypothetical protein [Methylorubrum aminovorans]
MSTAKATEAATVTATPRTVTRITLTVMVGPAAAVGTRPET